MFDWICPECGQEIAPEVKQCPHCSPLAAAADSLERISQQSGQASHADPDEDASGPDSGGQTIEAQSTSPQPFSRDSQIEHTTDPQPPRVARNEPVPEALTPEVIAPGSPHAYGSRRSRSSASVGNGHGGNRESRNASASDPAPSSGGASHEESSQSESWTEVSHASGFAIASRSRRPFGRVDREPVQPSLPPSVSPHAPIGDVPGSDDVPGRDGSSHDTPVGSGPLSAATQITPERVAETSPSIQPSLQPRLAIPVVLQGWPGKRHAAETVRPEPRESQTSEDGGATQAGYDAGARPRLPERRPASRNPVESASGRPASANDSPGAPLLGGSVPLRFLQPSSAAQIPRPAHLDRSRDSSRDILRTHMANPAAEETSPAGLDAAPVPLRMAALDTSSRPMAAPALAASVRAPQSSPRDHAGSRTTLSGVHSGHPQDKAPRGAHRPRQVEPFGVAPVALLATPDTRGIAQQRAERHQFQFSPQLIREAAIRDPQPARPDSQPKAETEPEPGQELQPEWSSLLDSRSRAASSEPGVRSGGSGLLGAGDLARLASRVDYPAADFTPRAGQVRPSQGELEFAADTPGPALPPELASLTGAGISQVMRYVPSEDKPQPSMMASIMVTASVMTVVLSVIMFALPGPAESLNTPSTKASSGTSATDAADVSGADGQDGLALEVTGLRFVPDVGTATPAGGDGPAQAPAQAGKLHYLLVNHSDQAVEDAELLVWLESATGSELGSFPIGAATVGPYESREMVSPVSGISDQGALPQWRQVRARVERVE